MSQSNFSIAIVGSGGIGKTHAGAAQATNGAIQVVATVDVNAEAAASLAQDHGAQAFGSVEELLASDVQVDGIVVCTPPSVRVAPVQAALEAGIPVLVEKPLGNTLGVATALLELAEKHSGVVTACGYCHRFAPAIVELQRMIQAGELGRLLRFENVFACTIPGMEGKWFSDPALSGGGSFIDTGCHSLDLLQFLAGEAKPLGVLLDKPWEGRGEAAASTLFQTEQGVAGVILSGWIEPARFTVSLVGTEALAHYDYELPEVIKITRSDGTKEERAIETHDVRFQRQLEGFAAKVRGETNQLATFAEGLKVAEMVDQALNHGK